MVISKRSKRVVASFNWAGLIFLILPSIANAYRLKELFAEFWTFKTKDEAGAFLSYWCDLAEESKIYPFIKAAKTLKAHWSGLVIYAETNLNNGILEGINSKIQLAKKEPGDTETSTTSST